MYQPCHTFALASEILSWNLFLFSPLFCLSPLRIRPTSSWFVVWSLHVLICINPVLLFPKYCDNIAWHPSNDLEHCSFAQPIPCILEFYSEFHSLSSRLLQVSMPPCCSFSIEYFVRKRSFADPIKLVYDKYFYRTFLLLTMSFSWELCYSFAQVGCVAKVEKHKKVFGKGV